MDADKELDLSTKGLDDIQVLKSDLIRSLSDGSGTRTRKGLYSTSTMSEHSLSDSEENHTESEPEVEADHAILVQLLIWRHLQKNIRISN